MVSEEAQALTELFKKIAASFPDHPNNPWQERLAYDAVHMAGAECPGVSIDDIYLPNNTERPSKWFRPTGASTKHVVLYMHGGGFSFGSPNGHRKLTAHLANASKCLAFSVDYRYTPEHQYPIPIDDCIAAYQYLLDQGFPPSNIALAGDSVGGGLVTQVPMRMLQKGIPLPACSVSLSPLYDFTESSDHGTMVSNAEVDVLNAVPFVKMLGERYLGGKEGVKEKAKLSDVSPIYASKEELSKMPPHWISAAGYDMLCDQGGKMAKLLQENGVEAHCEVHEGMQHVFEFLAGKAPEADKSMQQIGAFVQKHLKIN